MLKYYAFITALFILIATIPAVAQTALLDNANQDISVNSENIEQLIETLESKEEREKFIENLKTLQDASKENNNDQENNNNTPSDEDLSLTDRLGLDRKAETVVESYERFLEENNLNSSTVGKGLLTGIVFLVTLILYYINRKFFVFLREKLTKVRDKYELSHNRFRIYARYLRYSGYLLISCLAVFTLVTVWNLSDWGFIDTESAGSFSKYVFNVIFVGFIALVLWEIVNSILEYSLRTTDLDQSNRIQTLLPIIRNILFITFAILFSLVILSEIGINIVPLLAGAGIFGIAIGFGAQTMVKDFLTGFTIILEDLIQVGDVAKVGDRIGLVEKITIRKVQLRDLAGIVYTVPFSDITIIENWTKDFSYFLTDVGVAYREDTDKVIEHLRAIDEEMRDDEQFKKDMLEPIEILGVDQFGDSAVNIKMRIKTKPIKQWEVGREFNRRMKYRFDEYGVEIPFPHQTIYFGEDKEGNAPAAPIFLKEQKNASKETKNQQKKSSQNKKINTQDTEAKGDNSDGDG